MNRETNSNLGVDGRGGVSWEWPDDQRWVWEGLKLGKIEDRKILSKSTIRTNTGDKENAEDDHTSRASGSGGKTTKDLKRRETTKLNDDEVDGSGVDHVR